MTSASSCERSHYVAEINGRERYPWCISYYILCLCRKSWHIQRNRDLVPKEVNGRVIYGTHSYRWEMWKFPAGFIQHLYCMFHAFRTALVACEVCRYQWWREQNGWTEKIKGKYAGGGSVTVWWRIRRGKTAWFLFVYSVHVLANANTRTSYTRNYRHVKYISYIECCGTDTRVII